MSNQRPPTLGPGEKFVELFPLEWPDGQMDLIALTSQGRIFSCDLRSPRLVWQELEIPERELPHD